MPVPTPAAANEPLARVGAVIVSYRPDLQALARTLQALSPQVETIHIVDNGSDPATVQQLRTLAADGRAVLTEFPTNRGIAAAQNAGLAAAQDSGLQLVVLFDQDSLPMPDLISQLVRAYRLLAGRQLRVAAVGPQWVDERTGRLGSFYRVRSGRIVGLVPTDADPVEVDFLIASGTLLSLAAFRDVGPMREDFFIDHVDTEWCVRAKAAGWKLYGTSAARLTHALGDAGKRVWLGRWRDVALHSPERNYYEVRNTLLLMRSPALSLSWRIAQSMRLVQLLAFYTFLVPPRARRVRLMAKALRHGLSGQAGQLV